MTSISLLILTGGKSSRMGQDKSSLPWQDGTFLTVLLHRSLPIPFTNIIIATNQSLNLITLPGELHLSTGQPLPQSLLGAVQPQDTPYTWVTPTGRSLPFYVTADRHCDCGPLGGIEAGMAQCVSSWYAVLSVDMPYYDFAFFAEQLPRLARYTGSERPVLLPKIEDNTASKGGFQPLAAMYPRAVLPQIQQAFHDQEYKVRRMFRTYPTIIVNETARQRVYQNVNTPLEYKDARLADVMKTRRVPVFSITADASGTGKTTVAVALIKLLIGQGYRVGYIKSTHHLVTGEAEGTDTNLARKAGASMIRLVTPADIPASENKEEYIFRLSQRFSVDVVLVESRRHGPFPRIKICPFGPDAEALDCTSSVTAVISHKGNPLSKTVHQFSRDNLAPVFAYIAHYSPPV